LCWCDEGMESEDRLFTKTCSFVSGIWYEIFKWLGMEIVLPENIRTLLVILSSLKVRGKGSKGVVLVWHMVL